MEKLKVKLLVDFDSPLSVKYSEYCLKSFARLKDVLDIEPVQCITPEHPKFGRPSFVPYKTVNNNPNCQVLFRCNSRTFTEVAILESYYMFWKQLAEGEEFIMMEHDAYLVPEHEALFRNFLKNKNEYKCLMFGGALECWWINQQVARNLCNLVEMDYQHLIRGPMWYAEVAMSSYVVTTERFEVKNPRAPYYDFRRHHRHWVKTGKVNLLPKDLKVLWPIKGTERGKDPKSFIIHEPIGIAGYDTKQSKLSIDEDQYMDEEYRIAHQITERPCGQMIDKELGITNIRWQDRGYREASYDLNKKGSGAISVSLRPKHYK
jgi:hypothetical protein